MIRKQQGIYLGIALVGLAVLYFGFTNRPSDAKAMETSRAINMEEYSISGLTQEVQGSLPAERVSQAHMLEAQLQTAGNDSLRIEALKGLSGFWFAEKQPIIAGLYAKQVAEATSTAEGWSIAGTTFAGAFSQEKDPDKKSFAREQAASAFEKAISMEPSNVQYRINQALCYVEVPQQDQPMKGIQLLAGLAKSHPESALPPYHLARLAVRTGQWDRAKERIDQAIALTPGDKKVACLAAEIYGQLQIPDASKFAELCQQ